MLVDPDAAGDDRPDAHGRRARAVRPHPGQAGARVVDGRPRRRRGRGDPRPGRHPDVRLSRHRGARCSTTCGDRARTSALYETPALADDEDDAAPTASGRRRSSPAAREPAGPCSPRSSPRRSSRPTASRSRRRGWRRREDEAVAAAPSHRLPGRAQAPCRHDHPQDRRRRRPAEPPDDDAVARRVRGHPDRSPSGPGPSTSTA